MPLVVHSPYSGRPVKVRDEDIHRAIRDEEGRIFYVVRRSTGEGYYASPTRQGSEKDERRYLDMLEKSETAEQDKRAATATPVHDATGKSAQRKVATFVRLAIVLLLLLGLIYLILGFTDNLPEAIPNILPPISTEIEEAPLGAAATDFDSGMLVMEIEYLSALPGAGEQLFVAHTRSGQVGTAHEVLIDGPGRPATFGDGPDDQ